MNRFVLVLAIATFFTSPSRAQDSSIEEAKAHAARAKVHYDLGEYEKAADEYILVYRIRPLPALLYNIAQSYRQAGQYDKARQFYKSYLREAKDAPNRDAIERAIREIDDLLAKEKKAKDGPPKGVAQTPGVSGAGNAAAGLTPPPVAGTAAPSTAATSAPQPSGATSISAAAAVVSSTGATGVAPAVAVSSRAAIPGQPSRVAAPIAASASMTACTVGKDGAPGVPCTGCVTTTSLSPGAVTGAAIQDGAIQTPQLGAKSVTGAIIADATIAGTNIDPTATIDAASF